MELCIEFGITWIIGLALSQVSWKVLISRDSWTVWWNLSLALWKEKLQTNGNLFCRKLEFCRKGAIYFIVGWELYWKFSQCIKHRWWISSNLNTAWRNILMRMMRFVLNYQISPLKPGVVDGHGSHSNVRLPVNQLPDDPVPLLGLMVVHPVHFVRDRVDPGPLTITMTETVR